MKRTEDQVQDSDADSCAFNSAAHTAQQPKMSVTSRQPQTQLQAAKEKDRAAASLLSKALGAWQ